VYTSGKPLPHGTTPNDTRPIRAPSATNGPPESPCTNDFKLISTYFVLFLLLNNTRCGICLLLLTYLLSYYLYFRIACICDFFPYFLNVTSIFCLARWRYPIDNLIVPFWLPLVINPLSLISFSTHVAHSFTFLCDRTYMRFLYHFVLSVTFFLWIAHNADFLQMIRSLTTRLRREEIKRENASLFTLPSFWSHFPIQSDSWIHSRLILSRKTRYNITYVE